MFYDKFLSSILKKFNLVKINEEKFQENTQVGMLSIIISLIMCILSCAYSIIFLKNFIQCLVFNSVKLNGRIDWTGVIIPTYLLAMCCGPCMFIYWLIYPCKNKKLSTTPSPMSY
tara:strand:+ start:2974 stop:3318 length:345 start_codon:yes stop_codon:yes gene_type:complete